MKYRLLNILKPDKKRRGAILLSVCALIVLFVPDMIGVAYHKQELQELISKEDIDYGNMEILPKSFSVPGEVYKDPDEEAIISYLSSLDAYEIYASQIPDGDSIYILYKMDDIFRSVEFDRHYIVFHEQKKVRMYYVKEGIDMEMIKSLCDRL